MKTFLPQFLTKQFDLPKRERLERAIASFTPTERVLFYVLGAALLGSTLLMLASINNFFLIERPADGGTLSEGAIGSPRFINPLLAISDADRDLTALVYAGLLRATPDGALMPDLAARYEISENGLSYTFTLKNNLFFHDGTPISADDVVFTLEKAKDPAMKSPKRANWEGVTIEKVDEKTVRLSIKQAYAPFLENATLGILPKHVWKDVEPEGFPFSTFNIEPVGSGAYRIEGITRNAVGIPTSYTLAPFRRYALGAPHIKEITFRFYPSEKALQDAYARGAIESFSTISPEEARRLETEGVRIVRTTLPRVFGVFLNQNHAPVLANREVRQALSEAIDRETLVKTVLFGYGTPLEGPIPPGGIASATTTRAEAIPPAERIARARRILEAAKWQWNAAKGVWEKKSKKETAEIRFTLATSNVPELSRAAEEIARTWKELGIPVEVKVFESGDLNQNVIRPRKYDALLFGEIIGRDLDLFAFWHSSQRNDPGLNIALYTNRNTDKLLESARSERDEKKRAETLAAFDRDVREDVPAVFVYSPDFLYVVPAALKGFRIARITVPSERFINVYDWYIETEKVWKIFSSGDRTRITRPQ